MIEVTIIMGFDFFGLLAPFWVHLFKINREFKCIYWIYFDNGKCLGKSWSYTVPKLMDEKKFYFVNLKNTMIYIEIWYCLEPLLK